jgi:diaminohydroxyphosphoribosylaminopyrimidine deaminase/5-amino-6-(5-phosphoribosylamino)uracil reductase
VVLKWAETADRFIARPDGTSKWISGETARTEAHRWRAEEAGILVGTRTARLDDPALTVRHVPGKNPIRIVLDRNLTLPPTLKLFDHSTPTIVLNSSRQGEERNVSFIKLTPEMTPHEILTALHARGVLSVLIEGGSALLRGFIESDLWDEARIVQNPALKFGAGIAAPHITLPPLRRSVLGDDTVSLVLNHWSAEVQARCLHTST